MLALLLTSLMRLMAPLLSTLSPTLTQPLVVTVGQLQSQLLHVRLESAAMYLKSLHHPALHRL